MIKKVLPLLMVAALVAPVAGQSKAAPAKKEADRVTVYRSRTCGCCGKWVQHMKDNGFEVTEHIVEQIENAPGRDRVPEKLRSCHIAKIRNYVVEGHVPADVVKQMLKQRPEIEGIAVPGMPQGSPGMESPTPQPYDVVAWTKRGKTWTFARR